MQYNIDGTIFTDPTIKLHDARTVYDENGDESETFVSFNVADANDSISIELSDDNIPATHKKQPVIAWVNNRMKEYEM